MIFCFYFCAGQCRRFAAPHFGWYWPKPALGARTDLVANGGKADATYAACKGANDPKATSVIKICCDAQWYRYC